MPIFIYNSLTRKKEEFIPQNPPQINIYTCGVTVYDESHIGHARSLYIFDVIRRYLEYRGFQVNFVRNITDIDDKIINRANELKVGWQDLVKKYIDRYYEDLKSLGIEKADSEPRATENIPQMIKYIQGLIEKGFAYEAGGDVYFNVRKFPTYGKLSGQSIDEMQTGVRIEPSEHKKDPLDFALWKSSKTGEPSWSSPWGGGGRPGWHIECSVMSQKFLKTDTLDIHAGGRDLIFPHHENEIAQSEALTGKPFAKYWIHHGLLTINGQKMAKSLGNFVTIKDILSRYPSDVLKIFYLQAHYSSPIDFSWEKMEEAKKAYERILIMIDEIDRIFKNIDSAKKAVIEKESMRNNQFEYIRSRFIETMDDDFNMPQALAVVQGLITDTNIVIMEYPITYKDTSLQQLYFSRYILLKEIADILGLSLKRADLNIFAYDNILSEDEIELKIQERNKARHNQDYALSDKIRKDLEKKGIILEDRKDGKTTWRRKL